MGKVHYLLLIFWLHSIDAADKTDLLNVCLDSKHHKYAPGPEDYLHQQCTPWKHRSCCSTNTTKDLHEGNLYSLNYNHCGGRKKLSEACRKHFVQDHCFYECSPNLGPWIVKEPHRTWRNERFFGAPLCDKDCDTWFDDCKDDFTCVENWSRGFTWVTINETDASTTSEGKRCPSGKSTCKVNVCPKGSSCVTFKEMFGSSSNFCEKVFDDSWRYTPSNLPCMRLWFAENSTNPNDNISKYYAEKMTSATNSFGVNVPLLLMPLIFLTSVSL